MAGVIYKIVNLVTSDFYVGSTGNFSRRIVVHRQRLKRNKHHCKHLQAAWNKYGFSAFAFVIVKELDTDEALFAEEQKWLDEHVGKDYCYNHSKCAETPLRGLAKEKHPRFSQPKTSEERQKISDTLKEFYAEAPENHPRYGKEHTDEARAKISENRKGKAAGAEHYRFGKHLSDEVKAKISAAQLGKPKGPRILTEEGRAKIKAAVEAGNYSHWTGKKHTDEAKAKMSKKVLVVAPDGHQTEYASITKLRAALNMTPISVDRALKSGVPVSKGPRQGWMFKYV
jgi:group I intron endonuclease